MFCMDNFSEETAGRMIMSFSTSCVAVEASIGSRANVPNYVKKRMAKKLFRKAKTAFGHKPGEAYGLALAGILLESQTLAADDARLIEEDIRTLMEIFQLDAETPREAAEIFMKHAITDEEWAESGVLGSELGGRWATSKNRGFGLLRLVRGVTSATRFGALELAPARAPRQHRGIRPRSDRRRGPDFG
jgi:hypothetical protein